MAVRGKITSGISNIESAVWWHNVWGDAGNYWGDKLFDYEPDMDVYISTGEDKLKGQASIILDDEIPAHKIFFTEAGLTKELLVELATFGIAKGAGAILNKVNSVRNAKKLANFNKIKLKTVAPAKRTTGTTVLGKYPDYVKLSDKLYARRFQIPESIWNKMTPAQQWAANKKFLDRTIAHGDDILLSNPVQSINNVQGAFRKELEYLLSKGYRLTADGSRLVR